MHASRNLTRLFLLLIIVTALLSASLLKAQTSVQSHDAYVRRDGDDWILGTALTERRVRLAEGHFSLVSLRNKVSGREYQKAGDAPAEIRFVADGRDTSAPDWRWTLRHDHIATEAQGELQLDIELEAAGLRVTQHYLIYPGTAVIRQWITIANSSARPIHLRDVDFLRAGRLNSDTHAQQFNYITGGGNYNGSQLLKTEPMPPDYRRVLDSNGGIQSGNYSSFLPLIFLLDPTANEGLAIGWDYLGHWRFTIGGEPDAQPVVTLDLAGFEKDLAPGAQIDTPQAFTATFTGGLDQLGNQLLDWQYAYLWDFTNPDYFAQTRWAVDWPDPWVGDGGTPSADDWGRRLALDLRYVDLLRETGTDVLWDDAGWYDKWGTWNAPDWRRTNDYLQKYGMKWVLWYPTFLATAQSQVAQRHPDWLIPGQQTLEQSIPATVDWQAELLDHSVQSWGDYQWRYDIAPAASANDSDALAADQNFRSLLRRFKSDHPQSGIDACDGGGRWISYNIARFADSGEYTDGGVGPYSAYYTSLLVPPDKLHNVVDFDHTYYSPSTDRTHLSMDPTWYRDPGDGADVESIRKDWDLYHYLAAQGVVGRWSHVFRPLVTHDDPIWYFQRMNRDSSKGVIIIKHAKRGSTYFVTSRLTKPSTELADQYRGGPGDMNLVASTSAATVATGIYEDPADGAYRYYGVPGQEFGPLNVKYQSAGSEQSLVTEVVKLGATRRSTENFFGMALQVPEPMTVTQLGQADPGNNHGTYTLSLVRADDSGGNELLATAELDMSRTYPDAMGFKYAHLSQPVTLQSDSKSIVVYPRGLVRAKIYQVRAAFSRLNVRRSGAELMSNGITLDHIEPGELIFLNLSSYPGSGTDHIPPTAPSDVTKRWGTNLGVQGIELHWSPSHDNNWLSYYDILKNGAPVGRSAKGTFFFDHSHTARHELDRLYEVVAVDGDGNRSPAATAKEIPGDPLTFEALGDFSAEQAIHHWAYEQSARDDTDDDTFKDLLWDKSGYEGRWVGSGLGRIGRIWMQPSAHGDLSRTFIVPSSGWVSTSGLVRKDPSADNQASCFVKILHNSRQVWPAERWAEVSPHYDTPLHYDITNLRVIAGDKIRFVLKHNMSDHDRNDNDSNNNDNRPDPIVWDPVIILRDAQTVSPSTAQPLVNTPALRM